jgi:hypothetical protein
VPSSFSRTHEIAISPTRVSAMTAVDLRINTSHRARRLPGVQLIARDFHAEEERVTRIPQSGCFTPARQVPLKFARV